MEQIITEQITDNLQSLGLTSTIIESVHLRCNVLSRPNPSGDNKGRRPFAQQFR